MYFKTLWRYLIKNRVTSVINILGLSLGIVFCLVIYLITSHELSYDTFHPGGDRIYRIYAERDRMGDKGNITGMLDPMAAAVRDEISGLEALAGFYNYYADVRIPAGKDNKEFESPIPWVETPDVVITGPQYFDVFHYEWLAGNAASLGEPNMTVLTASKAHKYFGNISFGEMLGKEVIYNDQLHVEVAGIVEDWKGNTDFSFTDFISEASIPGSILAESIDMNAWGMWNETTQIFVKLAPEVEPSTIESQLASWVGKHVMTDPDGKIKMTLLLQPLSELHFDNSLKDSYSRQAHLPTLHGLMAIAAFILLIAAFNFINLSTAQSIQRSREVGVRKVMGASRNNLMAQYLGETFFVTLLAAALAVFVTPVLLSLLRPFLPPGVSLDMMHLPLWLFLLGVVTCTTLLAGFYPARVLSARRTSECMRVPSAGKNGSKGYLRQSLTVLQFTISLVLIICTLIIGDQMHYLLNADMGFDKDEIICIKNKGNHKVLAEKIKQYPYVQALSIHMETPASEGHWGTSIACQHDGQKYDVKSSLELCDENYIPLYGLQLVAGRNLQASDYMKEAVINETCAKAFGFANPQDAVGHMMDNGIWDRVPEGVLVEGQKRQLEIVGVVADYHLKPLHEAITPLYISATSQSAYKISVKLSTTGKNARDIKNMLGDFEKTWKEVNPNERLEISFYDDKIASFYEKERSTAQILTIAMCMAIFISCMGLFGLAVFTTRQRTKEIGIRKVLGASVVDILSIMSGDFLKLVFVATLIASPIAWYAMHRWLEGFAFRVPIHWWIFGLAGILAALIALVTISTQTLRAAIANPVKALKTE